MTGFFGASDLDTMLSGFGVPVKFTPAGSSAIFTGKAIFDIADQELYDADAGNFAAKVETVLVKTGAFPGLKENSTLTVDGVRFTVVQVRQEAPDGALTRVFLSRLVTPVSIGPAPSTTHAITLTSNQSNVFTPSGPSVVVEDGGSQSITIDGTAQGLSFSAGGLVVDGTPLTAADGLQSYTINFTNVTASHTVAATMEVIDMLHPFEFPLPTSSGKMLTADPIVTSLTNGARQVIFTRPTGAKGIVRNLSWIVSATNGSDTKQNTLLLEIKYDGSNTASVSVPLLALCGLEYPDAAPVDLEISTPCFELTSGPKCSATPSIISGTSGNLRLPIPFTNGIEISIVAPATADLQALWANVVWQDGLPSCWNGNLRFMASRSNQTLTGASAAGSVRLTDTTHAQRASGSFPAGVVAGTVLQLPDLTTSDILVLQRVDNTHLVVAARDTVGAILNTYDAGAVFSPCHEFLNRAAGEKGWLAAIVGGHAVPTGDVDQQFEANPRIFLDGSTEPDLEWTSIEDFANGSFFFSQDSRGNEGGVSSHDPITLMQAAIFKSFYKWPIRYTNGVRGTIPVWQAAATTLRWTTLFYVEV